MTAVDHIALVVDASSSMRNLKNQVISAFDSQIAWLKRNALESGRETRVSVYFFNDYVTCPISNVPVADVQSLKGLYSTSGWTALLDAMVKSQEDLAKTATGFGDHSFLTFVLTDGYENRSRYGASARLKTILASQGQNWTVAALVPDAAGKRSAVSYGIPEGNVTIWEIGTSAGLEEAVQKVTTATASHLTSRSTDPKYQGSKTLFAATVDPAALAATGMKALAHTEFFLIPVASDGTIEVRQAGKKTKARPNGIACVQISDMVRATGRPYQVGKTFYELVKSEKIDAQKTIAIIETATAKVYVGPEARKLIGLDDTSRRVRPMPKDASGAPKYKIFVQSTSLNRLLPLYTQILVLN